MKLSAEKDTETALRTESSQYTMTSSRTIVSTIRISEGEE